LESDWLGTHTESTGLGKAISEVKRQDPFLAVRECLASPGAAKRTLRQDTTIEDMMFHVPLYLLRIFGF